MQQKALKLQETSHFLREWLKAPLITASVIPSSERLAHNMVKTLTVDSGTVIELGPGTGVFTRQLLAQGLREEQLVLIELNACFAHKLRLSYPHATVINDAAEAMQRLNLGQVGAVVSGLPLLSMRDEQISQILHSAFAVLKPQGCFIQFTYGFCCPVKPAILAQQGLTARRKAFVAANLPPASVYHLTKHDI